VWWAERVRLCIVLSISKGRLDAGLDSRDTSILQYGVHRLYVEYPSIHSTVSLSQRHSDNFGNFLH
jgi:hypothetical protein